MSDKRMLRKTCVSTDKYIDDDDVKPGHPVHPVLGLPHQAFAIVMDINDPKTWHLPHHNKLIKRVVNQGSRMSEANREGKIGYEHTVDWEMVEEAVQLISLRGEEGRRVQAEEGYIISAARHLASHYQKAGKQLPDALAVLI